MLYRTIVMVLIALVAVPAAAAPTEITLTGNQVFALIQGLKGLDAGYDTIAKDGAREIVVRLHYSFSGALLLAIYKDTAALQSVVSAFQSAHAAKLAELAGPSGKIDAGSQAERDLVAEDKKLSETKQAISLVRINTSELRLGAPWNNPIPPSVLMELAPILDDTGL